MKYFGTLFCYESCMMTDSGLILYFDCKIVCKKLSDVYCPVIEFNYREGLLHCYRINEEKAIEIEISDAS